MKQTLPNKPPLVLRKHGENFQIVSVNLHVIFAGGRYRMLRMPTPDCGDIEHVLATCPSRSFAEKLIGGLGRIFEEASVVRRHRKSGTETDKEFIKAFIAREQELERAK